MFVAFVVPFMEASELLLHHTCCIYLNLGGPFREAMATGEEQA
jgi:hypothetical protein